MRTLLVAAAAVVVIAGMRAASDVIVPVLASALIAVLFIPAVTFLQRLKVPDWASVPLVFVGVVGLFTLMSIGVGSSVSEFNANLEGYGVALQERFEQPLAFAKKHLEPRGIVVSPDSLLEQFDPKIVLKYFGSVAGVAADTISNTFFILLTVAFILGEAAGFPRKLREAFGGAAVIEGESAAAMKSVREYLRIKTEVSIATGALAMLLTASFGVDFPILWGFVAFALNFIPTVGSIVAGFPPVLLAIVQHGWTTSLWVLLGYATINTVVGNVVEPRMMGRKLGLSNLVVWLSLVFWGWVWGPIGMLLSVPLTMLAKILLEKWDDLRWIAVLLGPGGEDLPAPATELREPDPEPEDHSETMQIMVGSPEHEELMEGLPPEAQ